MEKMVFGAHDPGTLRQFENCLRTGNVVGGVLCADGHYGYSQPVGGVIVYDGQISPSGVGFDIACGNKAVKTNLKHAEIRANISTIMDDIATKVRFGVGKSSGKRMEHPVLEDPDWNVFKEIGKHEHDQLKSLAQKQLGSTGSGNHYVDILVDTKTDDVWIGNHFGSRGFGYKTASGFLNLADGRPFSDKPKQAAMEAEPVLLDMDTEVGELYYQAMQLAGKYAYAGRDIVIDQVLSILGAESVLEVHNHHNYAWKEKHDGGEYIVVRKGATPAAPGQMGFVGGSMGDISVILQGVDSKESQRAYHSTIHGAGRIMSRTQAAGKRRKGKRTGGAIHPDRMEKAIRDFGVELRGGGTDESPFVYRKLQEVLDAHAGTIEVLHELRPVGVVMDEG